MTPALHSPSVERYTPKDKQSFSYKTVVHRRSETTKLAEGKEIIRKLSGLKHNMSRNGILQPIPDDGDANRACYNDELAATPEEDKRWFTMNWLFAECYLYRLLRSFFAETAHWKTYDPFFESKAETYKNSSVAIVHLANALNAMITNTRLQDGWEAKNSPLEVAFWEMIQADLWGNATDLSLLVDLDYADLQKLQAVGAAAQKEQATRILRDDLPRAWELLKTVKGGRVDIVLDNAGFEVYTDLVLADFLVSCTPFVDTVVFHPKMIPWFVSDVVPGDFQWTIESLLNPEFFSAHANVSEADTRTLNELSSRWRSHVNSGAFRLSVSATTPIGSDAPAANFWTTQYAYADLPALDPDLLAELQKSDLVIFKGDLNYRKLVGDRKWPTTTSFEEALGPLNGKINLVSLRTNKADTVCGLALGIEERLDAEAPDWRVSGKYAVVSYAPRTE
ncbi:hypothetical protein CspeluHIS016_0404050 [Cutaneotrichosporon spelunceum]|uniref:Sugar phosphate phosphatase n=1 Tax=Cutaneotrichosporon spelunceum TaxID=1672016 RepID=A0AAD3TVZ0_9TREE|nr:hypothetical protein CspeluHIS016_0404050 [Cutaneotrichosporon spelunceum]